MQKQQLIGYDRGFSCTQTITKWAAFPYIIFWLIRLSSLHQPYLRFVLFFLICHKKRMMYIRSDAHIKERPQKYKLRYKKLYSVFSEQNTKSFNFSSRQDESAVVVPKLIYQGVLHAQRSMDSSIWLKKQVDDWCAASQWCIKQHKHTLCKNLLIQHAWLKAVTWAFRKNKHRCMNKRPLKWNCLWITPHHHSPFTFLFGLQIAILLFLTKT